MKKFLSSVLMGTMILTSVAFAADVTERSDIELIVNGTAIVNENVPIIVNSRTLIPLRDLVTNLGVPDDNEHIIWNGDDRTVTILDEGITIRLTIDSDVATVNGQEMKLDAPAMIYNSRTYIPARFVGEALNKKIGWDNYESKVLVRDMEVYNEVKTILDKSIEVMGNTNKFKGTSNIDMGYVKAGSIMNMKTYLEMDIPEKEIYTVAEAAFLGMVTSSEQYYQNGNYYTLNEAGQWELIATEQPFESLMAYSEDFTNLKIEDQTIYDCFSIDYTKTDDKNIVLKSDLKYIGLLNETSAADIQSQILNDKEKEMIKAVKKLDFEYVIDRNTGCVEEIKMDVVMFDEEAQDDMYLTVTFIVSEHNGSFSVYSPIK